jgi:hypothetical protein
MRNGQRDGSAIAMGNGGSVGQRWRQWAMAGVTMGDSNSGGMILMAINGGGAMDSRTAVIAQWQLPSMAAEAKRAMATATRVAGERR